MSRVFQNVKDKTTTFFERRFVSWPVATFFATRRLFYLLLKKTRSETKLHFPENTFSVNYFFLRSEKWKKIQIPIFSRFLFPPPDFFRCFAEKNFSVFESKFRFRKLELRSFKLVFSAEIFHPEVFRRKCKFVIYAIFFIFFAKVEVQTELLKKSAADALWRSNVCIRH